MPRKKAATRPKTINKQPLQQQTSSPPPKPSVEALEALEKAKLALKMCCALSDALRRIPVDVLPPYAVLRFKMALDEVAEIEEMARQAEVQGENG